MQQKVEALWEAVGIISSKGKAVTDQPAATELGAFIGGNGKWLGASNERLLKLAKATLWLLGKKQIGKKSLQIVMGRWVSCMQFRRAFMSHFETVWRSLGEVKGRKPSLETVRLELLLAIFGMPLLHTWMGSKVDVETTCSDASMSGGAVACASELTPQGKSFLESQKPENRPEEIPVVLVSLFNGIGGASRAYDVAGVKVKGCVIADCHKPANRVYCRRWPGSHLFLDVKEMTKENLEDALMSLEPYEEIHLWVGFPCVDLSAVRAGRENLEGKSSGLFFEALRIYKVLKETFPLIRIKFVFENVASMDASARDEITQLLEVKPYKLDPANLVPMSRPRFCWTDLVLFETEEVQLIDKGGFIELQVVGEWPDSKLWLDEGSWETHPRVIYPLSYMHEGYQTIEATTIPCWH